MKFSKLIESFYNLFKNRQTRQILAGLMLGLFLALESAPVFSQVPPADPSDPQQLVREAEQLDRAGQWQQALENLRGAAAIFTQSQNKEHLAVTLANIGRIQLRVGYAQDALNTWEATRNHYDPNRFPNFNRRITVYETRALQALGHDLEACDRLANTLGISSKVCQDEKPSREEVEKAIARESDRFQNHPIYAQSWQIFGEVLRVLGKLETSQDILNGLLKQFPTDLEPPIKAVQAATFLSLGNTFRAKGNLERDRQSPPKYDYMPWRCEMLENFEGRRTPYRKSLVRYYAKSREYYRKITLLEDGEKSVSPQSPLGHTIIKAKLNLLTLLLDMSQLEVDKANIQNYFYDNQPSVQSLLFELLDRNSRLNIFDLPDSQAKIYAEIKLAKSQACFSQLSSQNLDWVSIIQQIKVAFEKAKILDNKQAKSLVLGNWGSFDEYRAWWLEEESNEESNTAQFIKQNHKQSKLQLCQNSLSCRQEAEDLSQGALYLAQSGETPHIAYRWEWQLGRLSAAQGQTEKAIAFYEKAKNTLDNVRKDLLTINSDVQFNFRDNIEPIYRSLVDLFLQEDRIEDALKSIDLLKLSELENFLQCDLSQLLQGAEKTIDRVDSNAVFVYPIILKDRVEVIFKLPNLYLEHRSKQLNNVLSFEQKIQSLRNQIKNKSSNLNKMQLEGENLYSYIIPKDLENNLHELAQKNQNELITLVFILDSNLQNIPMSILRHNNKYLIEDYAIAVIPSRQLFDSREWQRQLTPLFAGVIKKNPVGEEPLPYVEDELEGISNRVTFPVAPLVDEQFTDTLLEQKVRLGFAPIVHIATHGQFSSDPDETYIAAWGKRIPSQQLEQILQSGNIDDERKIQLLILSACKTATGNRRAILGLAGIAAQSQVRTTVGTLWLVDDFSTAEIITQFYNNLETEKSVTESLRDAQLTILNDKEREKPYYWAPFILVGNWM